MSLPNSKPGNSRRAAYAPEWVSDGDIGRAAAKLVERYGDGAWSHAVQCAADMFETGDLDGRLVWTRILEAIDALLKQELDGTVHARMVANSEARANVAS